MRGCERFPRILHNDHPSRTYGLFAVIVNCSRKNVQICRSIELASLVRA